MKPNNPGINNIKSNETNGEEEPLPGTDEEPATDTTIGPVPKFLIIKIKEKGATTFKNTPIHMIQKDLIGISSKPSSIKKLQNGLILVETKSDKQSLILMKVTKLGEFSVKVEPHRTLNSSRGIIKSYDLMNCTLEEIKSELLSLLVTDVHQITSQSTGSLTPLYVLTFKTTTLPKLIKIAYMELEVRPYIPKVLRCFNCQRFGHARRSCPGKAVCIDCGREDHGADSCNFEKKCVNCKGDHSATSVACPKWKAEEAMQQVRAVENISIREAKKRYKLNLTKAST